MQTLKKLLRLLYGVFMFVLLLLLGLKTYKPPPVIIKWNTTTGISCHSESNSDLPTIDKSFSPSPKSIYFCETSCKGGLNSRQACAIESAAKANPARQIYVFFNSPIKNYILERSNLILLQKYNNIKLLRVLITKFADGTPIESLIYTGALNKSLWGVEHTADVLRYLILYKWSGIYLDTDMVVVRSFDSLTENWAGKESDAAVNIAALAFSDDEIGRRVAEAIISEIKENYRGDLWAYNGPGAITRVLKNICNTTDLNQMTPEKCKGFSVYAQNYFYPVHWSEKEKYFESGRVLDTPNTYTHHIWNKLTHGLKVPNDSKYANLARVYCSSIYEMYGDEFGT
ncbi:unnamed protein product [Parnassius mnemosyne]|uniref:Alpha 1,4-glycosyltransferase domain-containing protein n=1 Tax=Parnassius mnemosyne TaxID=213953 RepID=A0AAV1LNU2_9NEOP